MQKCQSKILQVIEDAQDCGNLTFVETEGNIVGWTPHHISAVVITK